MDCSPLSSSVHGIFQARLLEWVAIPFSRGSSRPGIEPGSPALQVNSWPSEPPRNLTYASSFSDSYPIRPLPSTEWGSLCYTLGPHLLFLYKVAYIRYFNVANLNRTFKLFSNTVSWWYVLNKAYMWAWCGHWFTNSAAGFATLVSPRRQCSFCGHQSEKCRQDPEPSHQSYGDVKACWGGNGRGAHVLLSY